MTGRPPHPQPSHGGAREFARRRIKNQKREKEMELFNVRAIEVTKLAMDGLLNRQSAIAANTANSMTDEYQRKDVAFEDQLKDIIAKDDVRKDIRMKNSLSYNPSSANAAQKLSQEHARFLNQRDFNSGFKPEVLQDYTQVDYGNGNNVNVEEEMMDMAKTGSKYTILSTVEGKMLMNLSQVVKG